MDSRRTIAIPIPGPELERMKDTLAPRYGSELWQADGHRILVIRTPVDDPDVVNDLERAVEHLSPGDVADLDRCVLVGHRRTTAVSVQPLRDLMQERVKRDVSVAAVLRDQITGRQGHILYRDPDGTGPSMRLGIRIPRARAAELDDDDLELMAELIGPKLETAAMRSATAVHIIADEDAIRLDADLILQDLRFRWSDESRKIEAEEEAARKAAEEEARRRSEREEILGVLRSRYPEPSAYTPGAPSYGSPAQAAPSYGAPSTYDSPSASLTPYESKVSGATSPPSQHWSASDAARFTGGQRSWERDDVRGMGERDIRSAVDGLSEPGSSATTGTQSSSGLSQMESPRRMPNAMDGYVAPEQTRAPSPTATCQKSLESLGYEVLIKPQVPGHQVDLAGEREDEHPKRVIVRILDHVDLATAESMLRSCKDLETDMGLLVAPSADGEASERLIATKAKWVTPDDLAKLRL